MRRLLIGFSGLTTAALIATGLTLGGADHPDAGADAPEAEASADEAPEAEAPEAEASADEAPEAEALEAGAEGAQDGCCRLLGIR